MKTRVMHLTLCSVSLGMTQNNSEQLLFQYFPVILYNCVTQGTVCRPAASALPESVTKKQQLGHPDPLNEGRVYVSTRAPGDSEPVRLWSCGVQRSGFCSFM